MNEKTLKEKINMSRTAYLATSIIDILLIIIVIILFCMHYNTGGYILLIIALFLEIHAMYWLGYLRGINIAYATLKDVHNKTKEN